MRCHACDGHTDGQVESSAVFSLNWIRNFQMTWWQQRSLQTTWVHGGAGVKHTSPMLKAYVSSFPYFFVFVFNKKEIVANNVFSSHNNVFFLHYYSYHRGLGTGFSSTHSSYNLLPGLASFTFTFTSVICFLISFTHFSISYSTVTFSPFFTFHKKLDSKLKKILPGQTSSWPR